MGAGKPARFTHETSEIYRSASKAACREIWIRRGQLTRDILTVGGTVRLVTAESGC